MADAFSAANRKAFKVRGVGTFVLRRPSPWDKVQIYRTRVGWIGTGGDQTDEGWIIADIMAIINVTAETKPEAFSWEEITWEPDAWAPYYEEYAEWLATFRTVADDDQKDNPGPGHRRSPDGTVSLPKDLPDPAERPAAAGGD